MTPGWNGTISDNLRAQIINGMKNYIVSGANVGTENIPPSYCFRLIIGHHFDTQKMTKKVGKYLSTLHQYRNVMILCLISSPYQ